MPDRSSEFGGRCVPAHSWIFMNISWGISPFLSWHDNASFPMKNISSCYSLKISNAWIDFRRFFSLPFPLQCFPAILEEEFSGCGNERSIRFQLPLRGSWGIQVYIRGQKGSEVCIPCFHWHCWSFLSTLLSAWLFCHSISILSQSSGTEKFSNEFVAEFWQNLN